MSKKLNILFLSSRLPSHSANLGQDIMTALKEEGHRVSFGYPGIEKLIAELTDYPKEHHNFFQRVVNRLKLYYRQIFNIAYIDSNGYLYSPKGYVMFMPFEEKPKVEPSVILDKLEENYDIAILLFFQDMMTTSMVKAIDEKYNCPVVLFSPDMYPMTGGCYYFNQCRNFRNECYECPMFHSKDSLAHRNFIYKKNIYSTTKTCFLSNTWMKQFAEMSKIFENSYMEFSTAIIDEDVFKPMDSALCRRELGIPEHVKFVIFNRYKNMERKGIRYFYESMRLFLQNLSDEERGQVLLLTIDNINLQLSGELSIETLQLGRVDMHTLIKVYNASTLFLCPSIDDAGPSMINQSLSCGTPVVAFNSGVAIDVVKTGYSGYIADYLDSDDLAYGLNYVYRMNPQEYALLCEGARRMALMKNSKKAFSSTIKRIYEHFNS